MDDQHEQPTEVPADLADVDGWPAEITVPPLAILRTQPGPHGPQATFGGTTLIFDKGELGAGQAATLYPNRFRRDYPVTVILPDGSQATTIPARTGFLLGGAAELAERLYVTPVAAPRELG